MARIEGAVASASQDAEAKARLHWILKMLWTKITGGRIVEWSEPGQRP
jgi:hypothetical protein